MLHGWAGIPDTCTEQGSSRMMRTSFPASLTNVLRCREDQIGGKKRGRPMQGTAARFTKRDQVLTRGSVEPP